MKLNPKLKTFWKTPKQIKVLHGGRMSSKTMDTAGIITYLTATRKLRIACLRRYQNKLEESVFSTLKTLVTDDEALKPFFTTTERSIRGNNGSEFIFMGIERNLEEIKGLDNIDITWIEEAEKLTKKQWDLIRPTILRKEGSFCILVFNANLDTDFVYQEFVMKQHDNVLVQKINYTDNPFLSDSAKALIESDKKKLTEDEFRNIYLGYPKSENENALIKRAWIYECIDAHKKLNIEPTGHHFIGYDVADDGNDSNATVTRKGFLTIEIDEWKAKENELQKSSARVYKKAKELGAIINYDCIGVGAGVGSNILALNKTNNTSIKANKFNAGASVHNPNRNYQHNIKNKDFFANLKAQAWWNIADRFKATYNAIKNGTTIKEDEIISISSDIPNLEKLVIELSTPLKDIDNNGKVKVESKKDLAKRDVPSPNIADAFIMCYFILDSQGLSSAMFD